MGPRAPLPFVLNRDGHENIIRIACCLVLLILPLGGISRGQRLGLLELHTRVRNTRLHSRIQQPGFILPSRDWMDLP